MIYYSVEQKEHDIFGVSLDIKIITIIKAMSLKLGLRILLILEPWL